MSLAPWRPTIARALHRNRSLPHARYVQLATVRADGKPANRTIVFRGFLDNTNQLKFITDSRSEKPEQIEHSHWGEVCWYFPNTREQFRLTGVLKLIGETEPDDRLRKARQHMWQTLSDPSRLQFAWADPGKPKAAPEAFFPPLPSQVEPLPNFCLLLLDPVRVDHLELRGDPQNRELYDRRDDGKWHTQQINP
ncbi:Npun_F5749 family FMN-dependent PPOX-type flavoprotein [Myxacorys almedinensis]|uniref:Pyridoxamine 5'-phosphate oxidase n=1 Tax=Myxacorys almedinensis A TaxID=2690445 RepID=A0A8J7Z1Y7_9CYAN|nr:Npun_F5749 family FMN-dependent PPOX-type flavoprotein [Myxacorys almedinensis]NDJ17755.1 pyridoxamine 5'-phosphate oxidase [Myxacorys almedinensis A]